MDPAARLMEALSEQAPSSLAEAIAMGHAEPALREAALEALRAATPAVRWATAFEAWRLDARVMMALAVGFPVSARGLRLHCSRPELIGPPTLSWGSWVRAVSIPLQVEGSDQRVQIGVGLWPELIGGALQLRGRRVPPPDPLQTIAGLTSQLVAGTLADLLLHNLERHPVGGAAEGDRLSAGASGLLEGTFDALAERVLEGAEPPTHPSE